MKFNRNLFTIQLPFLHCCFAGLGRAARTSNNHNENTKISRSCKNSKFDPLLGLPLQFVDRGERELASFAFFTDFTRPPTLARHQSMARNENRSERSDVRDSQHLQRSPRLLGLLVDFLHNGCAVFPRKILQMSGPIRRDVADERKKKSSLVSDPKFKLNFLDRRHPTGLHQRELHLDQLEDILRPRRHRLSRSVPSGKFGCEAAGAS
jgi:hypothetical protein